jgi:hypothetical protein
MPRPKAEAAAPQGETSLATRTESFVNARISWEPGVFLLCCIAPAILCAYWKPLTHDELFSYEIARLGGIAEVWRALAAGADFHPPLDFVIRHLFMSLFGQSETAFRLPSLAATWSTLWCLYSFVARRTSTMYGLMAALIPLSTPVWEFSYDGRPYALMVALSAGTLVAWQRRTEGSRSALIFMALCLAGVTWTHWYGVLVFAPIAAGELVRSWNRRRVDWAAWAALATATAALLPLIPLMRGARQIGAAYWTKVGLLQALSVYTTLMEQLCIPAAGVLAVFLATGSLTRSQGGRRRAGEYEIAAVVGFLMLPLAAYILAKSLTGALITRYVLAAAIGIAIALAFTAWEGMGASAAPGVVIAATLCVSAFCGEAAFAWKQRQLRGELNRDNLPELVRDLPGPIVMTDNDTLLPLRHYQPPEVSRRLVYVADEKAALELQGYHTIERLFPRLERWSKLVDVRPYAEFVQEYKTFVLIDNLRGYIATLLWREGATITAKTAYRDKWVFLVELGGERQAVK